MLLGGLKNGRQTFDRRNVDTDATLTVLAVIAMSVPSLFNHYIEPDKFRVEMFSLTTASVIMILYILFVSYTLRSCNSVKRETVIMRDSRAVHAWGIKKALSTMTLSMAGIAIMRASPESQKGKNSN
jgi:Ca2+/H+ antiporter